MPRPGSRHPLLLYAHILKRWAYLVVLLGILLLALALVAYFFPERFTASVVSAETIFWILSGTAVFAFILALFLLTVRRFAYVQPFENHLRIVTPFLRLKISYRRIRQASSVEVARLYRVRGRRVAILRPFMKSTAIVLELNKLPLSRIALEFFLSPLFFPDQSPRIALLVPDWIKFSTELESLRSVWQDSQRPV
ncbi:MAG: hypothetical protein N2049_10450 [Anaerolineales bacterium]|nr:hypothetical protein [Anaerolineales bacterium]MCX7609622.1 hypothetical protein [Anaerolineales bacterium]MDW8226435.1 hypothetical protein [Anaerolineales bacterium]